LNKEVVEVVVQLNVAHREEALAVPIADLYMIGEVHGVAPNAYYTHKTGR
jgi:hypothetical protein